MSEPQIRIKGQLYPLPQNERLGELRLIERVTGVTHRLFRVRALEQQERIGAFGDDEEISTRQITEALDDIVMLARVAQAVQRANPSWSTERVAMYVDRLEEGDVELEPGTEPEPDEEEVDEEGPPAGGAPPSAPSTSPPGIGSAPPSSSGSDMGSSGSPTPASSGTPTSLTSPEERSDPNR